MIITSDTTLQLSSAPGTLYVFSASGAFGGGAIALQWTDGTEWVTFPGCSLFTDGAQVVTAPSTKLRIVVAGATSPFISANVFPAAGVSLPAGQASLTADNVFAGLNTFTQQVAFGSMVDMQHNAIGNVSALNGNDASIDLNSGLISSWLQSPVIDLVNCVLWDTNGVAALGWDIGAGGITLNGNTIQNVANPNFAQDAATKAYVDGQVNPIALLNVNLKNTGNTAIFTNNNSFPFHVTRVIIKPGNVNTVTVAPAVGVGINATANNVIPSTTLTGMANNQQDWAFSPTGLNNLVVGGGTGTLNINVNSAATATSMLVDVHVFGYYK